MRESALLVEVPAADPIVGSWRTKHDPAASEGIPAHVTSLFPFRPPDLITPDDLAAVAEIAAGIERFDFALAEVAVFPNAVWLRPSPEEPFRSLTSRLFERFPDHPPYGGRFPDPQPHLTVAMCDGPADRDGIRPGVDGDVGPHLPIACTATAVSLFVRMDGRRWARTERFAFR